MAELISSNVTGSMDVTGSISLNGEAITAGGGGISAMRGCQDFNSSGTFNTSTCGLSSGDWVHVLAVGAGGGGPHRAPGGSVGAGGGAVCSQFYKLTSNGNVSVTIGTGGTGGWTVWPTCNCNGNTGGCSRFGNVCAHGGGANSEGGGKNGAGQCDRGAFGFAGGGPTGGYRDAQNGKGGSRNSSGCNGFVRVNW